MEITYLSDHPELIPALAECHFAEWGCYRPNETLQARTQRLTTLCGRRSIPTVVIAKSGSSLLGGAMLVAQDMASRPALGPWLAGVYVKPEHRNQGVATDLIQRIAEEAQALSVANLYLHTDGSQSLYHRLGWSSLEQCEYKGLNVTIMFMHVGA